MDDNQDLRADSESLLGATIAGRYRIVSLIARGGMSKVFAAEQRALGRICALKVLSPACSSDRDPEFSRRFALEASTAAKLTHPNTVTIFDYGQCSQHEVFFIAMEFLRGRTLQRVLSDARLLPEARAVWIAEQIARSVGEAHRLGVVHRDLKPSNIFLLDESEPTDFVKVLDFGLVKDLSGQFEDLTGSGVFVGSPKYMAPEQITGSPVSPCTDVYMLGVVLYEMLTGQVPFGLRAGFSTLMAHVTEIPVPPRIKNPGIVVSSEVEAIVLRCLAKDPEDRFSSMGEVAKALRAAVGRSAAEVEPTNYLRDSMATLVDAVPPAEGVLREEVKPPISVTRTLRVAPADSHSHPGVADSLSPPIHTARPEAQRQDRRARVAKWGALFAVSALIGVAVGRLVRPSPDQEGARPTPSSSAFPVESQPAGSTVSKESRETPRKVDSKGVQAETRPEASSTSSLEPPSPTRPPAHSFMADLPTSEEPVPFQPGMPEPSLLSGLAPLLSKEATNAKVSGTAIARCTLTTQGTLTKCRILKSVPLTDEAVLASLASRRYRPLVHRGRVISVDYGFVVRIGTR